MRKSTKKQICTAAFVFAFGFAAAGVAGVFSARDASFAQAKAEGVTIVENYEIYAASIRFVADNDIKNGIRFATVLENDAYQAYIKNENAELGMLILPEDLLGGKELTTDTPEVAKGITYGKTVGSINVSDWEKSTFEDRIGYMSNVAYLYNIPEKNYNRSLAVRAYAFDGENYVYSETKTYSVSGVAYHLIQDAASEEEREKYSKFLNEYTVNFTETETPVEAQTVRYGDKIIAPAAPEKECYVFDGWYCGESKFDFENTPITKDLTLTAHYTKFAEMKLSFNGGGAWYGNERKEIDLGKEYANQSVGIEFKLNGTAKAGTANNVLGIFSATNASGNPTEYNQGYIDAVNLSSFNTENPNETTWNTVTLCVKTNSEGKVYLTGMNWNGGHSDAYDIYISEYTVVGYALKSQQINGEIYGLMAGLPTDFPAGTAVEVSMDVSASIASSYVSGLYTFTQLYGDYTPKDRTMVLSKDDFAADGAYQRITFTAKVIDLPTVGFISNSIVKTWSMSGNYVALGVPDTVSGDMLLYKNVTISEIYSMPAGTQKTTNPNGYYQSVAGLKTDIEAGTTVNVEMDLYITGDFDQYSSIVWVDTVYTTTGGEANVTKNVLENAEFKKGEWIHVAFTATVRNFAVLRQDSAYPVADTSSYGNAVYILVKNFKSDNSFSYKNVQITAKA